MELDKLINTGRNYQSINPLDIFGVPFLGLGHSFGIDLLNLKNNKIKSIELENLIEFGRWRKSKFKDLFLLNGTSVRDNSINEDYLIASHSFIGVIKVPLSDFYIQGNKDVLHLDTKEREKFILYYNDSFRNPMRITTDGDKVYFSSKNDLFVYNQKLLFENPTNILVSDLIKKEKPVYSFNEGYIGSMCISGPNIYLRNSFGKVISLNLDDLTKKNFLVDGFKNELNRKGDLKEFDNSSLMYSSSNYLFTLNHNSKEKNLVLSCENNIRDYLYQFDTKKLIVLTDNSLEAYSLENEGFRKVGFFNYLNKKINAMGA